MRFINWVSEFLEEVSWDERVALRVWREVISDWEVWRAALEEVREDWREVTLELWRREERWDFDRREVVSSRAVCVQYGLVCQLVRQLVRQSVRQSVGQSVCLCSHLSSRPPVPFLTSLTLRPPSSNYYSA